MWIVMLGGGIALPLTLALHQWAKRRHQLRLLADQPCPFCHTHPDDNLRHHAGGIGPRVRAGLDRFQVRYAAFVIHCEDCGSDLVFTADGTFIKRLRDRP